MSCIAPSHELLLKLDVSELILSWAKISKRYFLSNDPMSCMQRLIDLLRNSLDDI